MPAPYTTLTPTATPGQRYGSFAGKAAPIPLSITGRVRVTQGHEYRVREGHRHRVREGHTYRVRELA